MNPASISSGRVWWLMAFTSVVIVGLASSAAQRGSHPQNAPTSPARAATKNVVLPSLFVALPDGHFSTQTRDLSANLGLGGLIRFNSGLELHHEDARPEAPPEGLDAQPARVSYFAGADATTWQTGLSTFAGVRYRQIYPGIDMLYRTSGRLKSEYIVEPGANPARIRMKYRGSRGLGITSNGSLQVKMPAGELRDEQLEAFQVIGGRRVRVNARFRLLEPDVAGFELDSWDHSAELVIDPVISYSSYLGGSRIDQITGVAVDAGGSAYVCGWTDSQTFPVVNSIQGFAGSVDAFVAKIDPSGALLWATFIGGSSDDRALSIGIDPQGNAYLTGYTSSVNFPVLLPVQATKRGGRDVFVTKVNNTGTALAYSTYYGGTGNEQANGIAVDNFGQAYVVGETQSPNFPTLRPWRSAFGGLRDAFHFKIGVNGTISYSTFVGGSGDDRGIAVAVSGSLTPYIVGCTTSANFPTVSALQPTNAGGQDAFVIRFRQDADNVVYSSYLGGNGGASGRPECAHSIAIDSFNNMYVAGVTSSTNFPIRLATQTTLNGLTDGYLTKLNSDGVILFSTFIGGSASDVAVAVRLDSARRPYVTGYTTSKNLPVFNAIQSTAGGNFDVFLHRYDNTGSMFDFGTYFGGQSSETATALGVQPNGTAYIVGVTGSGNYPVQAPFQANFGGGTDGFITQITGF